MPGKIVVVTGISGSGSRGFCERAVEEGRRAKIYNTGDMIYDLTKDNDRPKIPKENFLNIHPEILSRLRDQAFEYILDNLPKDRKENDLVLIDTHAQFFWNNVYTNAYNWKYLNKIPIDMFVTIIDKPSAIKTRQMQTAQGRSQKHDLRDLLLWQNIEVNMTQGWASNYGKPAYVFSSKQHPRDVESLLSNSLLVYPSFSMTDATEADTRMIQDFKNELRDSRLSIDNKRVPIIDPADIDIETDPNLPTIVRETIDAQTVHRDLRWDVGKATHVIAYYPSEKTPLSKGSDDEVKEMHDLGGYFYLISPRKTLSPFYKYADKIFKDKGEFFEFWKQHLTWALDYYKR